MRKRLSVLVGIGQEKRLWMKKELRIHPVCETFYVQRVGEVQDGGAEVGELFTSMSSGSARITFKHSRAVLVHKKYPLCIV